MSGFDTFQNRLFISGELVMLTPLRIGTGQTTDATQPDQAVLKDSIGRPLIPGSSLKGVLRSHVESVLRGIVVLKKLQAKEKELVCDILDNKTTRQLYDDVEAILKNESISDKDAAIIDKTCLTCQVFGSHVMAGRFSLRDATVMSSYWSGHYAIRDGVAIDRDTGIAADKKVYNFEVVPAGTRFEFSAQIDNADAAQMGLALVALRALNQEQIQIGAARSRGLGWCSLEKIDYVLYENALDYLLDPKNSGRQLTEADIDTYVQHLVEERLSDA